LWSSELRGIFLKAHIRPPEIVGFVKKIREDQLEHDRSKQTRCNFLSTIHKKKNYKFKLWSYYIEWSKPEDGSEYPQDPNGWFEECELLIPEEGYADQWSGGKKARKSRKSRKSRKVRKSYKKYRKSRKVRKSRRRHARR
jgi:hypothetical protein